MTAEPTQRADEVWTRIIGLFGGDSVKRKYGPNMPAEWRAITAKLNVVELERGMRRLVHSGRDQVPSLPAFVKLCRTIGDDATEEGPRAPALPNPDRWQGDDWDSAGNRHLRAHITRRLHADPRCYGTPASAHAMQAASRAQSPDADASEGFVHNIDRLVAAKIAWAADMRDLAQNGNGTVPPDLQRHCWRDYLETAERDIAAGTAP